MNHFVLIVIAIITVACGSKPSNRKSEAEPAIYKGEVIETGTLPGVIRLDLLNMPRCSGVVVAEDTVLTAAHCFSFFCGLTPYLSCDLSQPLDDFKFTDSSGTYKIRDVLIHPWTTRNNITTEGFDLAIATLERKYNSGYIPIATAEGEAKEILEENQNRIAAFNDKLQIAGYGVSDGMADGAGILRRTSVPFRGYFGLHDEEIHLGSIKHHACRGDSGGPALIHTPSGFKVIGIASRNVTRDATSFCQDSEGTYYTYLLNEAVKKFLSSNVRGSL